MVWVRARPGRRPRHDADATPLHDARNTIRGSDVIQSSMAAIPQLHTQGVRWAAGRVSRGSPGPPATRQSPPSALRFCQLVGAEADPARMVRAVAARILGEILLMIVFCVIEHRCIQNLGGNHSLACRLEPGLVYALSLIHISVPCNRLVATGDSGGHQAVAWHFQTRCIHMPIV